MFPWSVLIVGIAISAALAIAIGRALRDRANKKSAERKACAAYLAKYGNRDGSYSIRLAGVIYSTFAIRDGQLAPIVQMRDYPDDGAVDAAVLTVNHLPFDSNNPDSIVVVHKTASFPA